jgi:hypothetical protein
MGSRSFEALLVPVAPLPFLMRRNASVQAARQTGRASPAPVVDPAPQIS